MQAATYGEPLFSHDTILKPGRRIYINDEVDSIDSEGAYTDKSASIKRVCIKLSTVTSAHEIARLKDTMVIKALNSGEIKKIMSAMELIENNSKGIQESKHPGINCFRIGSNRPDSGSDNSDGEAGRHIWNETREIVC